MAKRSQASHKSLVIVESPSKARTINKYLGADYEVLASMGHVRDLPANDLGVDLEARFEPVYQILDDKRKVVTQLRKAAQNATEVFLATDLDREGEAIAWHLAHALDLDITSAKRVVFNEITKTAIKQAFEHPHQLDMDKVNAQQARRILDRIVGYQLSPLLQRKIAKGTSAGRVQSVALRLIVEREREIRAFVPEESWRIGAAFASDATKTDSLRQAWIKFLAEAKDARTGRTQKERTAWLARHGSFSAELVSVAGKDAALRTVDDARTVAEAIGFRVERVADEAWEQYARLGLRRVEIVGSLEAATGIAWKIAEIQKKRTTSRPSAPFTTASLQQASSSSLGYAVSRTMQLAQQLYEGIDLGDGEGPVGLITYMRTDSTNLSADSVSAARGFIAEKHGERYLPKSPNVYASGKRAQEAHEAIRPTDVTRTPESLQGHLSPQLWKLYDLIWRRFVACQMTPAEWDSTTVLVTGQTPAGEAVFRATGRVRAFDGFLRVMGSAAEGADPVMPAVTEGQAVGALQIEPRQQFTSPPARYSEAALVKKLEAEGIGRPSTYAAIIDTIQKRKYVDLVDKQLRPTALGEIVTDKLIEHFPRIMDTKFTSYMEDELDKIEEAHLDWVHVLHEFYDLFKDALDRAQTEMQKAGGEASDHTCPDCGRAMVYRIASKGRFLSCSGYPECRKAMNVDEEGNPVPTVEVDVRCEQCGSPMALKESRLGPFLGCTAYPECTFTMPSDEQGNPLKKVKPEDIDEKCDECGSKMAAKFFRGKSFLGCTGYPNCKATKPVPPGVYIEKPKPKEAGVHCDKCGRPMVIRASRRGPFLSCSGFPKCRNAMPMDKIDTLKALAAEGKIPDAPVETKTAGRTAARRTGRGAAAKVDVKSLGDPPPGFAWTKTGRPVVETWPEEGLTCPDCGGEMQMKTGRFGPYWGCTAYPKCQFIANMRGEAKKRAEAESPTPAKPKPVPTNVPCDECGEPMLVRTGRTGPFLGCSKYPKCKATKPMPQGETAESLAATSA